MKKIIFLIFMAVMAFTALNCGRNNPAGPPAAFTATSTFTMTAIQDFTPTFTKTCSLTAWHPDNDNDGFGDYSTTVMSCAAPLGYLEDNSDCDDYDSSIYPGAIEVCDGKDNNCNGLTDEGITPPAGLCGTLGECASAAAVCNGAGGWTCQYPGTHQDVETSCSDGLDNDCDGLIDCDDPDCPCHFFTVTPTITETGTATFTATDTNTAEDTPTVTVTSTDTPVDTETSSAVPTDTESVTATFTSTPSATPSFTASDTETFTATNTATITATFTVTFTATITTTQVPGSIWSSVTGDAGFTARYVHSTTVFNNKMWVIAGYDGALRNDVWSSPDGATWTEETPNAGFLIRDGASCLAYDNGSGEKIWILAGGKMGGYCNDILNSADGINWVTVTAAAAFPVRYVHSSVVYDSGAGNEMWIIGGNDAVVNMKDVWHSQNGVDWFPATKNAAFGVRSGQSSVVYNGLMWVIGGYNGTTFQKDVWYSANGADWSLATGNAAFGPRSGQSSVVYDGKMWMIGGNNGVTQNDVWYSTDGAVWIRATIAAAFSQRANHTSVVLGGYMYVIAGVGPGPVRVNDVWRSR